MNAFGAASSGTSMRSAPARTPSPQDTKVRAEHFFFFNNIHLNVHRPGAGVHRQGADDGGDVQRAGRRLDEDLPVWSPHAEHHDLGHGRRKHERR
jgi:hypothetical protein